MKHEGYIAYVVIDLNKWFLIHSRSNIHRVNSIFSIVIVCVALYFRSCFYAYIRINEMPKYNDTIGTDEWPFSAVKNTNDICCK